MTADPQLAAYLRASAAENTWRAYASDLRHFLGWGGAIPASPRMVASYLADHAGCLAVATLDRRLAAISRGHAWIGAPSPTSAELVRMTMRGIRRRHTRPQRAAAPITTDILARMLATTVADTLQDRRDRALLLLGFAAALRRSELCAINCTDLVEFEGGLLVTISRSKTDQLGVGRRVGIPGAAGLWCPVRAIEEWRQFASIIEGPLLRPLTRGSTVRKRRLSPEAVGRIVKRRAALAGLDPGAFSGHSLRAGLITSAAAAGVPSAVLRTHTGQASDGTLMGYIRDDRAIGEATLVGLL